MTTNYRVIENEQEPILDCGPGSRSRVLAGATHGTKFMSVVERWLDPGAEIVTHRHPEGVEEVIWVRSGQGEFWVDDERQTVGEDTTLVIPPLSTHGVRAVGDEPLYFMSRYSAARPVTVADGGGEGEPEVPGS